MVVLHGVVGGATLYIRRWTQISTRPRATSRDASSVGVMYRSSCTNIGSNPREGRILKKNCYLDNFPSSTCWKIGVKSFLKRYHQQSFLKLFGERQQQVIMHLFYLFSAILSFLALYFLSFNLLSLQLFGYPHSILYGGEDFVECFTHYLQYLLSHNNQLINYYERVSYLLRITWQLSLFLIFV